MIEFLFYYRGKVFLYDRKNDKIISKSSNLRNNKHFSSYNANFDLNTIEKNKYYLYKGQPNRLVLIHFIKKDGKHVYVLAENITHDNISFCIIESNTYNMVEVDNLISAYKYMVNGLVFIYKDKLFISNDYIIDIGIPECELKQLSGSCDLSSNDKYPYNTKFYLHNLNSTYIVDSSYNTSHKCIECYGVCLFEKKYYYIYANDRIYKTFKKPELNNYQSNLEQLGKL